MGGLLAAHGQAVYGQHLPAAIMFVEVATDDGDATEDQVRRAGGSWCARSGQQPQDRPCLPVRPPQRPSGSVQGRQLPPVIRWHEKVAEHYGIPSVNMGQFVARKILAGELTFEAFSKDGIHPTDRGHAFYAEAIKPLIVHAKPRSSRSRNRPTACSHLP